ncbi:MAG: Gfo/Idh/MocA family oxidoreductase [Rhodothermales bacterium]|nr:Gfo/Idh/MocA family oxidoreductase [Rhodothermales bacterium]MBO6779978.1 Gfo/Idh/MocA family oxidoreductase [Rhodothermales bacterium]
MNRRTFIKTGTLAAAAGPVSWAESAASPAIWTRRASALAPSDTVRLGILGAGSRGKDLMRHFLRSPGVEFGGICDVYEPRFAEARQITEQNTPVFEDFRGLVESDVDAIVVATPLGLHAEHMVAAVRGGKHVFGEKSLALTQPGCDQIRNAVQDSDRLFQVGHQYRYAGWYQEAVRRIREGEIGRVTHIHAFWHRNYNWRRHVPEPGLERLINWRLYREWSGGLLAELGSHHIETANWIFDALPVRAMGSGAITFYQDGRETYDNVQVIYDYPEGRKLFFSSVIGNRLNGFQIRVFGTTGTILLTLQDGEIYHEQATENSAIPEELLNDPRYTSPTLATDGDMPYRGTGHPIEVPESMQGDPTTLATAAFVEAIRSGKRPEADIHVGWGSGNAVAAGNRAMQTGMPVVMESAEVMGGGR